MVIVLILGAALIKLWFDNRTLKKKQAEQDAAFAKLLGQKKSSEVRLGQISENLAPFLKNFKYDPKRAHFLGMPIDYIVFEEDRVVFLEVKSGEAQLSSVQKNIKQLIKDKKVEWDEMRIN